jgi:hypothetical protein
MFDKRIVKFINVQCGRLVAKRSPNWPCWTAVNEIDVIATNMTSAKWTVTISCVGRRDHCTQDYNVHHTHTTCWFRFRSWFVCSKCVWQAPGLQKQPTRITILRALTTFFTYKNGNVSVRFYCSCVQWCRNCWVKTKYLVRMHPPLGKNFWVKCLKTRLTKSTIPAVHKGYPLYINVDFSVLGLC